MREELEGAGELNVLPFSRLLALQVPGTLGISVNFEQWFYTAFIFYRYPQQGQYSDTICSVMIGTGICQEKFLR